MTINKKYLLYAIIPVFALATVGGAVLANSNNDTTTNPMSSLVNAIAVKFNLKVSDVQAVFDEQMALNQSQLQEHREEMKTKFNEKFTDKINQAVADGKITQAQADLIIAKKAEIELKFTNLEGKTQEEIFDIIKTQTEELKQWLKDNNISLEYFAFGKMGFHGLGNMGFQHMGMHNIER